VAQEENTKPETRAEGMVRDLVKAATKPESTASHRPLFGRCAAPHISSSQTPSLVKPPRCTQTDRLYSLRRSALTLPPPPQTSPAVGHCLELRARPLSPLWRR
jgi:hypothetical protein